MHSTSNGPKSLQTTKRLRTRSSTFWSDSYNGVMGYEPGCLFPLLNGQQTEAGGLKSQLTQGQNIVRRWGLVSDISPLSLGVYHVHPVLHSRRLIEHENGTINQSINLLRLELKEEPIGKLLSGELLGALPGRGDRIEVGAQESPCSRTGTCSGRPSLCSRGSFVCLFVPFSCSISL